MLGRDEAFIFQTMLFIDRHISRGLLDLWCLRGWTWQSCCYRRQLSDMSNANLCSAINLSSSLLRTYKSTVIYLTASFTIMDIFNIRNTLWNREHTYNKGRKIVCPIGNHNLCLRNDGSALIGGLQYSRCLSLVLCTAEVVGVWLWKVDNENRTSYLLSTFIWQN